MKKIIFILCISITVLACKKDSKSTEKASDQKSEVELITMTGEFIYYADAAVLQTTTEIYGVVIDDKMHELNEEVKQYKVDDTDMVSVTVKVRRFEKPKNEEGWPYRVEIKEILKVEKPDTKKQDIIKLGQ
jgi:hypothetical protein